jgi:hypothetical protein
MLLCAPRGTKVVKEIDGKKERKKERSSEKYKKERKRCKIEGLNFLWVQRISLLESTCF